MIGYAARRLIQTIPTIFVMSIILFGIMQAIPAGPMAALASTPHQSYAAKLAIIHRWGLDLPVSLQYFRWIGAMFSGDWQNSFFLNQPVNKVILARLPATLLLMTVGYLLTELLAIPAGILAALKRYSFFDQFVTFFAYVGNSMPTFWLGLMLLMVFSGAVVTERIFTWPGMGQLFFQALEGYDYPLMMGILFVSGLLVIFFNVLADFAYAIADPRISYA